MIPFTPFPGHLTLLVAGIALLAPSALLGQIKVACLGEQTTHSFHRENDPEYPLFLAQILNEDFTLEASAQHPMGGGFLYGGGTKYRIGNFGHPRGTVLDHALENPKAILRSDELKLAQAFAPDIVVLGPFGDHEPLAKVSMDSFTRDLQALINRIATFVRQPTILLALPLPRGPKDDDENYRRVRDETRRLAGELSLPLIDLWTPFLGQDQFYQDATHLTVPGRRRLAEIVAEAVVKHSSPTAGSAAEPQHFDEVDPGEAGVDPSQVTKLDALLQSFVDNQKLGSVVGFVAKGGKVVYEKSFGWKDVENRVPASVDDYYVLFSQTKAVTTVAFMTLVEQGRVAIDDPVSKYFPGIPDRVVTKVNEDGTYETRPVASPMTFLHLITHTSGLGAGMVRNIRRAERKGDEAPMGFGGAVPKKTPSGQHSGGGNPESKYLEEEMLALAKYPLGFDPGTKWNYHVSTNMLGYLIERISGKPLREYVKETVLTPLGMADTDWYYEPEDLARFVKPYRVVEGKLEPGPTLYSDGAVSEQQTYAEGAIGLNGPIRDYAKFCQMLLNQGEFNGRRILKPETVRLMTTINRLPEDSGAEKGFQFGLGFELHPVKKPVPAVSDSAFAWGGLFGTAYIIDPENDLIALFYMNMYNPEPMYPRFLEQAYRLFASPDGEGIGGSVVLEDGGRGPFPAIVTEDAFLPGMTIYRPRDLSAFGEGKKLPILLWGNGACVNTTQEHKLFLNEIASHGYLILALGRLDRLDLRDEVSNQKTRSSQLVDALDWILAKNGTASSGFFDKVDPEKVAAMGMSCGGLQAIEISGDPRIRTTVVCNSGVLRDPPRMAGMPPLTKDALLRFHGPVLYLMGGPSDIAYENAMDDFRRLQHVPIVMTNLDVGHAGTYARPHGGEYTPVALAWLDWQLKGDESAAKMFLGADSVLKKDKNWTVETKNFERN
jgi:CubicO group peptidase (beta-lactamase class C family)